MPLAGQGKGCGMREFLGNWDRTDYHCTASWQVIEERYASSGGPIKQHNHRVQRTPSAPMTRNVMQVTK